MQNTQPKRHIFQDQFSPEDITHAVSQNTYSMVTDVLANKIMTALSAGRIDAALETATELFALFDKGVSARGINGAALANTIMDMIIAGQVTTAELGKKYLNQIAKQGADFSTLDIDHLSKTVEQSRHFTVNVLNTKAAEEFLTDLSFRYMTA